MLFLCLVKKVIYFDLISVYRLIIGLEIEGYASSNSETLFNLDYFIKYFDNKVVLYSLCCLFFVNFNPELVQNSK